MMTVLVSTLSTRNRDKKQENTEFLDRINRMYRIKMQKEFVFILSPHPVNPVNPVRIPNSLLDILRIDWTGLWAKAHIS